MTKMFDIQDSEKEEECSSAEHFKTSPTLLHLESMKNKLNIAYLSRDMMKWNSYNMENELKKVSVDISSIYENFAKKTKKAYLLLARCKYFDQEFYRNVREGVKTANLVVHSEVNNIAGVNLITYNMVMQTTKQRIPFISRGGQTIQEAKNAWTELLTMHVKMAELRHNFLAMEFFYSYATKRQNIIDQIILPKTQATIKYITTELEEINREETSRVKMVSVIKKFKTAKRVCPCTVPAYGKKDQKEDINEKKPEPLPKTRSLIEEPITITDHQQYQVVVFPKITTALEKRSSIKLKSQEEIKTLTRFYELVSFHSGLVKEMTKKQSLSVGDCDSTIDESDRAKLDLENFLEVCRDVKDELIDNFMNKEIPIQLNSKLIAKLKSHVETVIRTNGKLLNITVLSQRVKSFITACGKIDVDIKIASKDIDHAPLDEIGKKRIKKLIENIDTVAKIIKGCNDKIDVLSLEESRGITTSRNNIDLKVSHQNPRLHKLDCLRKIESDVESLTAHMASKEMMKTSSIQQFLSSCKGFKKKLEEHKKDVHRLPKLLTDIQKQQDNQLSASLIMFMNSCQDYIKNTKNCMNISPDMSNETFIAKISEVMSKWRTQGILGESTIEFMKTAKQRWTNDNNSYRSEAASNGHFILSPEDESLGYTSGSTANSLFSDKTRQKNVKNETKLQVNYGDINPTQREICDKNLQIHRGQVLNKQEDMKSRKDVEKSAQYSPKLLKSNVTSTSRGSYVEDVSASLLTESITSNDSLHTDSEVIVAEISTYDSCPVFEPNNFDVWLLETRCDTVSNTSNDPSHDSLCSVENETCLVYSTEKPEDHVLKMTYTI